MQSKVMCYNVIYIEPELLWFKWWWDEGTSLSDLP